MHGKMWALRFDFWEESRPLVSTVVARKLQVSWISKVLRMTVPGGWHNDILSPSSVCLESILAFRSFGSYDNLFSTLDRATLAHMLICSTIVVRVSRDSSIERQFQEISCREGNSYLSRSLS